MVKIKQRFASKAIKIIEIAKRVEDQAIANPAGRQKQVGITSKKVTFNQIITIPSPALIAQPGTKRAGGAAARLEGAEQPADRAIIPADGGLQLGLRGLRGDAQPLTPRNVTLCHE
jgi:hypothetical protein